MALLTEHRADLPPYDSRCRTGFRRRRPSNRGSRLSRSNRILRRTRSGLENRRGPPEPGGSNLSPSANESFDLQGTSVARKMRAQWASRVAYRLPHSSCLQQFLRVGRIEGNRKTRRQGRHELPSRWAMGVAGHTSRVGAQRHELRGDVIGHVTVNFVMRPGCARTPSRS